MPKKNQKSKIVFSTETIMRCTSPDNKDSIYIEVEVYHPREGGSATKFIGNLRKIKQKK
jgi:hypothetical protein